MAREALLNADKSQGKKGDRLNSTFAVFEHIKHGGQPKQLWEFKRLTENQVKYALRVLKHNGFIKKITKGVWENIINEIPQSYVENRGSRTPGVTMSHTHSSSIKSDMVRLHGMRILIKLPKFMRGWNDRIKFLQKKGIKFEEIVQGQRIAFEDVEKIWLTDKSIYIYFSAANREKAKHEPFSWYGKDANESAFKATNYILAYIARLERYLRAKFSYGGKYRFKFTNRHYSLIKNAIAQKYHEDNKKFFAFDDSGCWALIDNSFNFLELETIHPETAHDDNMIVQGCLNDWKGGITPRFLMESINEVSSNQEMFNSNFESHVKAINALEKGVGKLTDVVSEKEPKKSHSRPQIYDKGTMITW